MSRRRSPTGRTLATLVALVGETSTSHRQSKSSVYVGDDDVCWLVTQTPSEVAEMLRAADGEDLVELTLGNRSGWNSKPLYVRARSVTAVGPPRDDSAGDES